jgi:ubiquitin-like 1-activating enzyme E1 B
MMLTQGSLDRLSKRLKDLQAKKLTDDSEPSLSFDKDDEDTLDFVTATANLRADTFHIGITSKFDTKRKSNSIKGGRYKPN